MSEITVKKNNYQIPSAGLETLPRHASLFAGTGYIVLFALAFFANFFVRESMVISGDAAATAANIAGSQILFRSGMISFLIIFLLDVPIAWALYILFRRVHKDLSLLSAWFRILYTVFLGVALIFFFQALQYLGGAEFINVYNTGQLNVSALLALETFNTAWLIGLAAFGLHLIMQGSLILKSKIINKYLGWVLIISGFSYFIDTAAHTLLTNYNNYAGILTLFVAVPSVLAEGWFGIWLIVKGGKNNI